MGLLTVPKKYNPPGNGKRDMENLIYATKAEQGLLKARGGSGKMTKHGIRSFGLGDKGNAVGSAGGSNYAGDGQGGQVNLDGVGMGQSNVLRSIGGKWTVVSRDAAAQIDAGGGYAPARPKPAVPMQPVVTPVAVPIPRMKPAVPVSIPANFMGPIGNVPGPIGPQIGGTTPAAVSAAVNGSGTSSAWGGSTTNSVSPLGAGNTFGAMAGAGNTPGTAAAGGAGNQLGGGGITSQYQAGGGKFGPNSSQSGAMPSGGLDRYADASLGGKFGVGSSQAGAMPSSGAVTDPWGGMGKMGLNSGQTSPYNQPSPSVAMDPSIAGRLAATRAPGYGVPSLAGFGQTVAKTPGPRVNLPASPPPAPGPGTINEMLNGLQSGWAQPDIADPRLSYPSEEGQVYGPASLASYPGVMPKIQDRVSTRPTLTPGQTLNNQTINDAVHQSSMLNASRIPSGGPVSPASFGPETPAGPADWQQGDVNIDPTSSAPLDYAKEIAMNTPIARAATGIMSVLDRISGGPAYRDDVSLGTDESGMRTDRAPAEGGGFSPGSFGPGGQDRRGGPGSSRTEQGGPGYQPQGQVTAADKALIDALPAEERDRLMKLARRDKRQFMIELAKLRAKTPTTTPPPSPPPPQQPWYYPQYTQTWANLPTGLGGMYGRI